MTLHTKTLRCAIALSLIMSAVGCGDDSSAKEPDASMGVDAPVVGPRKFHQVEHLARPAINEALLITDAFLNGYNATAPSFAGVDTATLNMVIAEAKTVLKALYLGGCLLNGTIPGVTAATGAHPAGMTCHAIGPALWVGGQLNGTVLTPESKAAAQAYADAVFGLFIPDVERVDTSAASGYLTPCGGGPQLLCGGRLLNEDTIDITYNFLLNGANPAITKGPIAVGDPLSQFRALLSDGVNFSLNDAKNSGNVTTPVPNPQQFHPDITGTFPYSALPF